MNQARPFLKWAGGKQQLLSQYAPYLPDQINTYYEMFVGGGAMFWHLRPRIKAAVLIDLNKDLINAYVQVRDHLDELSLQLERLQADHCTDFYYEMRSLDPEQMDLTERAARFIYLNKTCFNGLYRTNRKGKFNVPIGSYDPPKIYEPALLKLCSEALQGVVLVAGEFTNMKLFQGMISPRDFIYADPPYYPLNQTSSFTSYTAQGFKDADHVALEALLRELKQAGAHVLVSNSDCERMRLLYGDGWETLTVQARRSVNSKATRRGKISELLSR